MIYSGFSIEQPDDRRWSTDLSGQTGYSAMFKLDVPSSTHSFIASVTLSVSGRAPESPRDLETLVRESSIIDDTNRYDLLDFSVHITTNQGRTGATYSERLLDRYPTNSAIPLVLFQRGYMTPHPDNPNVILSAMYTERGRKEEVNHAEYTDMGETFLRGVRFEKLPRRSGAPPAGANLETGVGRIARD